MLTNETKELEAVWEMGKMIMECICLHYIAVTYLKENNYTYQVVIKSSLIKSSNNVNIVTLFVTKIKLMFT